MCAYPRIVTLFTNFIFETLSPTVGPCVASAPGGRCLPPLLFSVPPPKPSLTWEQQQQHRERKRKNILLRSIFAVVLLKLVKLLCEVLGQKGELLCLFPVAAVITGSAKIDKSWV